MDESSSVSQSQLQRVLLIGLCLSAALLLSALLIAIRTVRQINTNLQTFTDRQNLAKAAIDEIEKEQNELNARWLTLARKKDSVSRQEILDQLSQAQDQMGVALESAYEQAELLRESIYQAGHGLLRWTVWLFASCVILSLLCASWAVQAASGIFKKLGQQSAELTRMQYQFLETQEETARRFSHELHDELGQALTAIKANLSALRGHADEARVNDCMQLVETAIADVREMSQLLRPTILDDFGLDAALRSLTESFSQRTGISVEYKSDIAGRRLRDDAETNLYRIGQEALTNIARHSGATAVSMSLTSQGSDLRLTIRDNGRGFDFHEPRERSGLGLAGMETRARGCGGKLRIQSAAGKGLEIEVTCPIG